MEEIAVVYMVAGMSSRFGGKIKQFVQVGPNGETLIEFSINQALKAGIKKIIFIVGEKTEKPFKEKFGNKYKNIQVEYAFQKYDHEKRDKPWGTTDALCSAKELINCPFIVCNGDDIYGEEPFRILTKHLQENTAGATIGYKLDKVIPKDGTVNRGIFQIENSEVTKIKEIFNISKQNITEKNLSDKSLTSMNLFALHPEDIKNLNKILEKFKLENSKDRKIECLLPEDLQKLIHEKKLILKLYSTESKWFGVTNPEDEQRIKEKIKK